MTDRRRTHTRENAGKCGKWEQIKNKNPPLHPSAPMLQSPTPQTQGPAKTEARKPMQLLQAQTKSFMNRSDPSNETNAPAELLVSTIQTIIACGLTQREAQQIIKREFLNPTNNVQEGIGATMLSIAKLSNKHNINALHEARKSLLQCWLNINETRKIRS